ncbi:MAG: Gfo/Idh/MocA family oxidoreductase, partial [Verrucomicrobiota bacterium]
MKTEPNLPVRIAAIGAGGINASHKVACEKFPERIRLVGVADPVPAFAEKLAAPFGAPAFSDPGVMLDALGEEVDAVLVTTPHFLHHPHACLALERGLPVLVEKPVTCTLAELRELQDLEQRTGAFVQAGQMQRFGREENWLKAWLNSADFGEPRLFNLDIYQNIECYVTGKTSPWILDKAKAGGGVVASVAIHILDLLRYWFEDDFVEVTANGRFDAPMLNGAESCCTALLKTRRGILGTLNCSYTVARTPYSQRSLVFGTRGTLAQHMDPIGGGYAGPYFISTDGGLPSPEWGMMYSGFERVADRMAAESEFFSFGTNDLTQMG